MLSDYSSHMKDSKSESLYGEGVPALRQNEQFKSLGEVIAEDIYLEEGRIS